MTVKLFDSELKVMDLLWKKGDISAKEIAAELKEQIGWSKTTTYTVIKYSLQGTSQGNGLTGSILPVRFSM